MLLCCAMLRHVNAAFPHGRALWPRHYAAVSALAFVYIIGVSIAGNVMSVMVFYMSIVTAHSTVNFALFIMHLSYC